MLFVLLMHSICVSSCTFALLWIQDQSLCVSHTGESLRGNRLLFQEIIFQVDRNQGGARITRVAHCPLPHLPKTQNTDLN